MWGGYALDGRRGSLGRRLRRSLCVVDRSHLLATSIRSLPRVWGGDCRARVVTVIRALAVVLANYAWGSIGCCGVSSFSLSEFHVFEVSGHFSIRKGVIHLFEGSHWKLWGASGWLGWSWWFDVDLSE